MTILFERQSNFDISIHFPEAESLFMNARKTTYKVLRTLYNQFHGRYCFRKRILCIQPQKHPASLKTGLMGLCIVAMGFGHSISAANPPHFWKAL